MSSTGAKPRVFISHTPRDHRDTELAHKLAIGLKAAGAEVFIAPEGIPPGEEWARKLEAEILERCTHFLLILSAAACDSDWVQWEIKLAKGRRESDKNFGVLTLRVGRRSAINLPAELADFLHQFQDLPYHSDFAAQLEEVTGALKLPPVVLGKYVTLIYERTRGFVGRDYVFAAIEEFLTNHENGYFVLEGDPGMGKTAIMAKYVLDTGCLAHFNVRSIGENKPRDFLQSICGQLIARYGLTDRQPPHDAYEDGRFLARLLDEAAQQLAPEDRLVIAVDALDEVDFSTHPKGANILFLPPVLPSGVIFVLSVRRELLGRSIPWVVSAQQKRLDLLEYSTESRIDIRHYLMAAVAEREGLRTWLEQHNISQEQFVETLAEKSENNFMYLHYVLPALADENSPYRDLSIQELPDGLKGYYKSHWRRMGMQADPLPREKLDIIYVLCEARRPISRRLIAKFSGHNETIVQAVIDEWREFLHEELLDADNDSLSADQRRENKRYSIYHSSFRDFLHRQDIVQAAGVELKEIHGRIAGKLLEDLRME